MSNPMGWHYNNLCKTIKTAHANWNKANSRFISFEEEIMRMSMGQTTLAPLGLSPPPEKGNFSVKKAKGKWQVQ